jgi:hypothetical protein
MVKLFHSLDYEVKAVSEGTMIYLEAQFGEEPDISQ